RRDAAIAARIRDLAARVDWAAFAQLALDQAVLALVFRTLDEIAPDLVPDDVADAAAAYSADQSAHNTRLADELVGIVKSLGAASICAVPFKGPLLAEQVYGDLALRRFRDLDFLIPPTKIDDCYATLERMGYRGTHELTPAQAIAFRAYAGEDILFHESRGTAIEPHWAFAPHTLAIDLDYEALWQRMRPTEFRGVWITTLSDEDMLLALAIHGGKEQWTRLQWVCDFAQAVRRSHSADWPMIVERAQSQGCLRHLVVALTLAHDLLELDPPSEAVAAMAADPAGAAIARRFALALFTADNQPPSIYCVTRLRCQLRERWRDRFAHAWRTITTPRVQHYRMLRLPDALFALYWPAKLVHDYLLLPFWLMVGPLRRRNLAERG
ncbi:MAG: nucleotidyltransferase family protein, partial [Alphaproteobacteria bacterium]|nr:nucleotidyltransferase family protein [Alphaproteobacteria bacterium]